MSTVALAVTDGMLHFELALAYEVFGADLSHVADPWYSLVVCGPGAVRAGRFRLEPDHGLDRLSHADTVIVPGWADAEVDPPAELVDAVRAAHEAGARVASSARARSSWRPPACWTAGARPRTGRTPRSWPPAIRGWRWTRTSCTWTTAACSPPRARPRPWTCAFTSCASTTAPRSPTRSPAAWSCRRTGTAARPSSSPPRCPPPATTRSPNCSPGSWNVLTIR